MVLLMPDFYPPKLNPHWMKFCQLVAPAVCYCQYRMSLQIHPDGLQRLDALGDERVILLANHPTYHDWIAIFLLSAKLGKAFHYLAAYERFKAWNGALIQRLGAYSVRRGLGDRASVAFTLDLLTQPAVHLVIFPEGGCSFQNDTVMPFRPGAVQIALQALNRVERRGESVPNLYAVPVSLKYRYTSDMRPVIDKTLRLLERVLGVANRRTYRATLYQRLRIVAEKVLVSIERDYDLHDEAIALQPWNDRIPRIKAHAIQDCETQLNMESPSNLPIRERVYRVQYELESRAASNGIANFSQYEALHRAAASLLNFDAIYDGYVAEAPTPERFLDTLIRLERQVFNIGYPQPKGRRQVLMHVGEPVNLKDYLPDYQRDRPSVINNLTHQLHGSVQYHLNQLIKGKLD
jgi:1-acyl-sn-glycerol-3-phosphate acyltransferase